MTTRPSHQRQDDQAGEPSFGSLSWAFDLGFAWSQHLDVSHLGDSRDVMRTLRSDLFDGLTVDWIDGFKSADHGICEAKAKIKEALDALDAPPCNSTDVVGREGADLRDNGWRPIASAPKIDRSPVLVSWTHDGSTVVGEAEWRENDDEFWRGWWWANTSTEYEDVIRPEPTHWRPLPAPPHVASETQPEATL